MPDLHIAHQGCVTRVALNRPHVRNAFNAKLIGELTQAFEQLPTTTSIVILGGNGKTFCAGADITWMRESIDYSEHENAEDAQALVRLFRSIDESRAVVIGRIHGAALGGGVGLVACCDIVVAEAQTKFAFSEVRLGIVPAVIAPFVLPKIGVSAARRYFVTGEMIDMQTARSMGLVHEVVTAKHLDAAIEQLIKTLRRNGPSAMGLAKKTIREVTTHHRENIFDHVVDVIAAQRVTQEAQEGFKAFLEKREAQWPGM